MELFRLYRARYGNPLSGEGAAIRGGRWNSPGSAMVYTAGNRALAMTEVLVHLSMAAVPADYMMARLYLPDDLPRQKLDLAELPAHWRRFPPPTLLRQYGDNFLKQQQYLALQVPSAVVPGELNYLLHPKHPYFHHIKLLDTVPFHFEERLFSRI